MARAYSLDLRERVIAFVASGQTTQAASAVVRCQRGVRREVDATRERKRECGRQADLAASCVLRSRLDRSSCLRGSNAGGGDCKGRDTS